MNIRQAAMLAAIWHYQRHYGLSPVAVIIPSRLYCRSYLLDLISDLASRVRGEI
jgi:hypothetical protein